MKDRLHDLKSIYEDGELDEAATCKEFLQVRREGTREVAREIEAGATIRQFRIVRREVSRGERVKTMSRYLVVIEKAGRNYSAWCPDLPGCVATGKTREAVHRAMQEAMEMHLEGMREDGMAASAMNPVRSGQTQ